MKKNDTLDKIINTLNVTGEEYWSFDHENLLQFLLVNTALTTAPEDIDATERALRLNIKRRTRKEVICELEEGLMSNLKKEKLWNEALETASSEPDWDGDDNRVTQIYNDMLVKRALAVYI